MGKQYGDGEPGWRWGNRIGRIGVQGGVGGPGLGMRVVAKIPPPRGETFIPSSKVPTTNWASS